MPKRIIFDILLWCLLAVLLVVGFLNSSAVRLYPPVSLRYDTPISGQTAYKARQYSVQNSENETFWPTFWREDTATLKSELASIKAGSISFSGESALVWPAEYLTGTAPGAVDITGCAISSALAWRLWGSADVVGKPVDIDGEIRIVRGIFGYDKDLVLLSYSFEDTSQDWNAAELSGGKAYATRSDAESFAMISGLGKPDAIIMGSGLRFLSSGMALLPLIIVAVYAIIFIVVYFARSSVYTGRILLITVLIVFAIGLPLLLNLLPPWLIPSRWSDFSFWANLKQQITDNLREFLAASPGSRDVESRLLIIKQAGIAMISACCAIIVCFRLSGSREKPNLRHPNICHSERSEES